MTFFSERKIQVVNPSEDVAGAYMKKSKSLSCIRKIPAGQ